MSRLSLGMVKEEKCPVRTASQRGAPTVGRLYLQQPVAVDVAWEYHNTH